MSKQALILCLAGTILFLIGLIQGAFIPNFLNPKMALSAHLAAVQSGMVLIIFGAIWSWVKVSPKWEKIGRLSGIVGMYLTWLAITLSAVFGTKTKLEIAGAGYGSSPIYENIVVTILMMGAGLCLAFTFIICAGLWRAYKST